METDGFATIDHEPRRRRYPRRRRSPLEITLIAGFIFSLAVGLIALGVLFWLRTPVQAVDVSTPAALALQPNRIAAPLALMELAGDPPDALARQALAAGYADTAFAIAVYGVELPPPVRRALLHQVALQYMGADRPGEAAIALYGARSLAVLSPELSVTDRHQALIAAADTSLAINDQSGAEDTLTQALRSAVQTPGLLPAQRAEVFEAIRPLAQAAAADLLAAQAGEYARNPFLNPGGHLLTPRLYNLLVSGGDAGTEPVLASLPVPTQVIEQRQFAARILAERIQLTGGIDIEPEQQALANALLAEDLARDEAYRASQATESITPAERLRFHMAHQIWLAKKARIAQGGFGLTLVPQWEAAADSILTEYARGLNALEAAVGAVANMADDPVAQQELRAEALLLLAREWSLGLYVGGQPSDLSARLQFVYDELARLDHPPALLRVYNEATSAPGFEFASN